MWELTIKKLEANYFSCIYCIVYSLHYRSQSNEMENGEFIVLFVWRESKWWWAITYENRKGHIFPCHENEMPPLIVSMNTIESGEVQTPWTRTFVLDSIAFVNKTKQIMTEKEECY